MIGVASMVHDGYVAGSATCRRSWSSSLLSIQHPWRALAILKSSFSYGLHTYAAWRMNTPPPAGRLHVQGLQQESVNIPAASICARSSPFQLTAYSALNDSVSHARPGFAGREEG